MYTSSATNSGHSSNFYFVFLRRLFYLIRRFLFLSSSNKQNKLFSCHQRLVQQFYSDKALAVRFFAFLPFWALYNSANHILPALAPAAVYLFDRRIRKFLDKKKKKNQKEGTVCRVPSRESRYWLAWQTQPTSFLFPGNFSPVSSTRILASQPSLPLFHSSSSAAPLPDNRFPFARLTERETDRGRERNSLTNISKYYGWTSSSSFLCTAYNNEGMVGWWWGI